MNVLAYVVEDLKSHARTCTGQWSAEVLTSVSRVTIACQAANSLESLPLPYINITKGKKTSCKYNQVYSLQ